MREGHKLIMGSGFLRVIVSVGQVLTFDGGW